MDDPHSSSHSTTKLCLLLHTHHVLNGSTFLPPTQLNQKLKKREHRFFALTSPHIQPVGRHFKLHIRNILDYDLFFYTFTSNATVQALLVFHTVDVAASALLPPCHHSFSQVIQNTDIIMSFSC